MKQNEFDEAVKTAREVFPRRDRTSRITDKAIFEKHLPQVVSLKQTFEESDPPLHGSLVFADLLCDAGAFFWDQQIWEDAASMEYLAEKLCIANGSKDNLDPIYSSVLEQIAQIEQESGLQGYSGRISAKGRYLELVRRRERYIEERKATGELTREDQIDLARTWNDCSGIYLDLEEIEEGESLVVRATELYRQLGDETTLPFRFAQQNRHMALVRTGQSRHQEALEFMEKSVQLARQELGEKHFWYTVFRSEQAMHMLIAGLFDEALAIFEETLFTRIDISGELDPGVCDSIYWLGVANFWKGDYSAAELNLRRVLKNSQEAHWGKHFVGRAQFLLAMVLHRRGKEEEAVALEEDAKATLPADWRDKGDQFDSYDIQISIWNTGRTTGGFAVTGPKL